LLLACAGDPGAQEALYSAAYGELRQLARSRLRHHQRLTQLGTTELVHETYLRLQGAGPLRAQHRRGYFQYASRVMRSVIVDAVREHQALRRGGDLEKLTLSTQLGDELAEAGEDELLRVNEALEVLAQAEPRLAQVVEMRFFGGYTEAEVGEALGLTERSVRRDWVKAKKLLAVMLTV
jgi:RNA polymerase sigma factor (TIGR02999 family)